MSGIATEAASGYDLVIGYEFQYQFQVNLTFKNKARKSYNNAIFEEEKEWDIKIL